MSKNGLIIIVQIMYEITYINGCGMTLLMP